ncbi:hypothetical protein [Breoghania sp.]|uniref:hypothetical protein n=1 Tax=Breoghania sp. TaxID=2065378 RepID=UPI0026025685|nr:hypothetical protein [Breoghania sp.]MDJ0932439.1 hypothetical protein [Breoghania sp.]
MLTFIYRFWYLSHGLKVFERNALDLVEVKPVEMTLFGNATSTDDATCEKWLDEMRRLGQAGA